ncbi:MAG: glycosyltransferase [candidate division Zixibacteria bacterium]|nr:glycosyltransferase [candidate division Zixibacteria bacterium]
MKKVLIIAYDFPPARTSGVYRPLKFAKYLPDFGWQPIILTVKNPPKGSFDESLLAELGQNTPIYRAYSLEPKRFEKMIFDRAYGNQSSNGSSVSPAPKNGGRHEPVRFSARALLKRLVLSPLSHMTHSRMYVPDERIGWVPFAVKTGLHAIRQESVDLIFSTSPPETNHLVGGWLARLTKKPWVVDFRDPWTDNFIRDSSTPRRQFRERKMEEKVLTRASLIVNVGSRFSGLSQESFPKIPVTKHEVITNGYDESDYCAHNAEEIYHDSKKEYLNIVNIGTLYDNSGFEQFLKALEALLKDKRYHQKLRVTFIGDLLPMWKHALSREPFASHVELVGFKPHKETVRAMMAADLLLLMPSGGGEGTSDKIIPGKLFEFLRSGRPILLVGWPGETADIIVESGSGTFAASDNIDGIVEALRQYLRKKESGELAVSANWEYIKQYDRKYLTGKLVKCFERLV